MSNGADNSNPPASIEWSAFAPLVSLALLVAFFALATDDFLSLGILELVLRQGSVLAIVAVGLTFVLICGEIDLSVGMMALWSACCCGVLFEQPFAAGVGGKGEASRAALVVVLLAPLVSSVLLGTTAGLLTVWSGLPSFILTLAMMNVADGLARYATGSQKFAIPRALEILGNGEIPLPVGEGVRFALPYCTLLAAIALIVGHVVLRHTRFGRFVYMTGGNREAARLAGVRPRRVVVASLAICAATAAIGGLVNAGRLNSASLDQNADLLLSAVACVVLGGASLFGGEGGMPQTLVGVLTFSVLQVGLNQITWIEDLMRPLLMGVVLTIALVANGLLARRRPAS